MGLDMYLTGRKFYGMYQTDRMEDGFPLEQVEVHLGYWRKHSDLHGFIVQTFAEGVDECQDIELSIDNINTLIDAITDDQLVPTTGFFFGQSYRKGGTPPEDWGISPDEYDHEYEQQKRGDLDIFGKALGWMAMDFDPKPFAKYVIYRASW